MAGPPLEAATERCASCNKVLATEGGLTCQKCLNGCDINGRPFSTRYCNFRCQENNRQAHYTVCKNKNIRKSLYRAGEILQEAFLMYREIAWAWNIVSLHHAGARIYCDQGATKGVGPFFEFPAHLVPDEGDRRALLSYCGCVAAQEMFVEMGNKLLTGVTPSQHLFAGVELTSVL